MAGTGANSAHMLSAKGEYIPLANDSFCETDKALMRPLAAVSDQALKLEQRLAKRVDGTIGC